MTLMASTTDPSETFDTFAAYYDQFTDYPAYPEWIRRLERLARQHGVTGKRALDVGCGTGKSILPLVDLGYTVFGCDSSERMLGEAARKLDGSATLVHAAAEALPRLGSFDYVSCLNDVCNYIIDAKRLLAAFAAIAANLASDGIFLFDANTPTTYREFFATTHWRETSDVKMVWHGPSPGEFALNATVEATVEIFVRCGDLWQHRTSRHLQRHYDADVIANLLERAGLRVVALYGQTDAGPPEQPLEPKRHTKMLFLAGLT